MNNKEFIKYYKNPWLLNSSTMLAIKALVEEYPAFDTAWALWLRNLKNLDQGYDQKLQQTAIRIKDRKWLKKFMEMQTAIPNEIVATDYLQIADYTPDDNDEILQPSAAELSESMRLIENFLQNQEPNMETETAPTVDHKEIEERSAADDEIVTETFADILLSQNKFESAIDIFSKLILKFPEKSTYFAARIEKVKEKMI